MAGEINGLGLVNGVTFHPTEKLVFNKDHLVEAMGMLVTPGTSELLSNE